MNRLLMLAVVAAFGLVGCKGTEEARLVEKNPPMIGANAKAPNGNVMQTSYRQTGAQGVQQAGGMTPAGGSVVPAAGGSCTMCPNGTCPTGACANGTCPTDVCPNGTCGAGQMMNTIPSAR